MASRSREVEPLPETANLGQKSAGRERGVRREGGREYRGRNEKIKLCKVNTRFVDIVNFDKLSN